MNGPQFLIELAKLNLPKIVLDDLTRIPVAIIGRFVKGTQKFSISKADMAKLVENFRARKTGEILIDYEHASEFPELAQGGAIPAAGWLKEIDDAPDASGILWGGAEFTTKAKEMIKAKEYKYLSPVIDWGARKKDTGEQQGVTLTSMALVNRPFLEAMPAITLSDAWVAETTAQQARKVILADRAAGTVRVVFEDGTESVLWVEGLQQRKILHMSDVKRGDDGRLDFAALATKAEALIAGDVFAAMLAQDALDAAVKGRKITAAQRPFYEALALCDLAGFKALTASMKSQTGEGVNELEQLQALLDYKIREKQAANKGMQYHEALKLVASENPDLDSRRTQLMRR